jgi:hypothetical protein
LPRTAQALVLRHLSDAKAEVRTVASDTLAGLIKALPPAEVAALLAGFQARARELFSRKRGSGDRSGPAPHSLEARLGVVMGLRAFLAAAPYDVGHAPAVFASLQLATAAADSSAEVKQAVAAAVSQFKRTHEADALALLRAEMSYEAYEAYIGMESSASYFV